MRYYLMTAVIVLALIGTMGCQREAAVDDTAVLMKVGKREIHQDEFQRAYRVFRAAYGAEADEEPAAQRAGIIRFIQQLSDEMVLMAYAQDKGVAISTEDLNQSVEEIRQDYPEGLFDQMLLETAVNFTDWKEALRRRLTIERLVQQELAANIMISESDIADYYRENESERPLAPSSEEETTAVQEDQMIIQQLRRQKTEEAYGPWIEAIRAQYPVTIDQDVVKRIIADSGIGADDGDSHER
jgi:hypothetical protein